MTVYDMKKSLIATIFLISLIFLLISSAAIYKDEIVYFLALKQEIVGDYENEVFESCRLGEPREFSIEADGIVYTIPLPNGATVFANASYPPLDDMEQFLVINYEFYDEYIDKIQNLPDYTFDQMGLGILLESKDKKVVFQILSLNYARRYERLNIGYEIRN